MARKSPKKSGTQSPRKTEVKAASVAAAAGMVRKSTCFLAMLGALLLGVYLGMLAPRFLDAGNTNASQPVAQSVPEAESRATPPMPPEMAKEIARVEKNLLDDPLNADLWTALGNLYFDTGQSRQAVTAYEKSLKLRPDNADVLTDLGIMYRETEAYDKAVECFRKAVSLQPRHENAIFNEGVVLYYDLHRRDEAIAAWQRLLQINPGARTPDGKAVSEMLKALP